MRKLFTRICFALTVVGALTAVPRGHAAGALDIVAAEMAPIELRVADLEAGLKEIERRANNHVAELERWVVWWTKVKELATATGDELKKSFEERIQRIQLAQGLIANLSVTDDKQARGMPHIGAHSRESLSLLLANTRAELVKWTELIAQGKAQWVIAAAGAVTGEFIQKKIDDYERQIDEVRKGVKAGTYGCSIAGFGAVTGRPMRDEIAALEERRRKLRAEMAAGNYRVEIPGLGPRTRNQVDAEIAAIEAELNKRRQTFQKGELAVSRPNGDWMNANQLRAALAENEKSYELQKKLIGEGLYKVWIVNMDLFSQKDLEGRVQALEKTIEDVRVAVADGEYRANVLAGWNATRKELEKYIGDLQMQSVNPALDAAGRAIIAGKIEKAQKSISELQAISAYDLAILAAENADFSKWATSIMKLAKPDFDRREIIRLEREEMLADISIEAEVWFRLAERQLTRLRTARTWIPSGS